MTETLTYLSVTETVEVNNYTMFGAVFKLEGSPEYYPNGAIKKTGKVIENINHKLFSYNRSGNGAVQTVSKVLGICQGLIFVSQ